jgi:hypothetical protein
VERLARPISAAFCFIFVHPCTGSNRNVSWCVRSSPRRKGPLPPETITSSSSATHHIIDSARADGPPEYWPRLVQVSVPTSKTLKSATGSSFGKVPFNPPKM